MLVELGDARGFAASIDSLELGGRLFDGSVPGNREHDTAVRTLACRTLRVYSQQPLPCDPHARDSALAEQITRWRGWWQAAAAGFRIDLRKARLDLQTQYDVRPATIGTFIAH